ncbi:MAG: hypothetical protein K2Y71_03905 [Xanthobacteraceae bacterium]|nr:hypothetical protein [Xanthobacteraceae bacterium]
MTVIRIMAATFALSMGMAFASGAAAAQQCKHSASEYAQVIRHFESEAAKARMLADRNPLYEADVGYYTAALAAARACHRNVGPLATASR